MIPLTTTTRCLILLAAVAIPLQPVMAVSCHCSLSRGDTSDSVKVGTCCCCCSGASAAERESHTCCRGSSDFSASTGRACCGCTCGSGVNPPVPTPAPTSRIGLDIQELALCPSESIDVPSSQDSTGAWVSHALSPHPVQGNERCAVLCRFTL